MPTISIEEKGCRYCTLCADICPTDVFDRNEERMVATVARKDDCIGCASCFYVCPSRCITITEYVEQPPFHRIEENAELVAKFLQRKPVGTLLTQPEWQRALRDVSVRLSALGDSVTETMGRGGKAVGRKAGMLAAAHLPEMYEGRSAEEVLSRMRNRFGRSFAFESSVLDGGTEIALKFTKCALHAVVESSGGKPGDAVLCQLFHEYWAGLVGAFTNRSYGIEMGAGGGDTCTMRLRVRS